MTEILQPKGVVKEFLGKADKKFICIQVLETVWLGETGEHLKKKSVAQGQGNPKPTIEKLKVKKRKNGR